MERDSSNGKRKELTCISTHTLTWSVTVCHTARFRRIKYFNSHAHVERDLPLLRCENGQRNFNSHAHVERDLRLAACSSIGCISTHTLTWSVTFYRCVKRRNRPISTHTLTWSVTTALQAADIASDNFNSHAHVERDIVGKNKSRKRKISTHTLTWSVTDEIVGNFTKGRFQLTRSRGA